MNYFRLTTLALGSEPCDISTTQQKLCRITLIQTSEDEVLVVCVAVLSIRTVLQRKPTGLKWTRTTDLALIRRAL